MCIRDRTQKGDAVDDAFSDLLDNAGSMNDVLSDRSDIASADLRADVYKRQGR